MRAGRMSRGDDFKKEDVTLLLADAAQIVTLRGESRPRVSGEMREIGIVPGGSVAVSGTRIVEVGSMGEIKKRQEIGPGTRVIDCRGKVVTPGLIDPHTHPVFAVFRLDEYEMRSAGVIYQDIFARGGGIGASVRALRGASREDLYSSALPRLDRFLLHGTTTIEAKSGYGLTLEDELKTLRVIADLKGGQPLDIIPTFLGAHAVPPEFAGNREGFLDLIAREMIPAVAKEGLARYFDCFVEENYFAVREAKELFRMAGEAGLRARVHADELTPMGGAELAAEVGAITADHLVRVSKQGIAEMARCGVIAVLLPGTTFFLGSKNYAPARAVIDGQVPVALGTDFNPGTCPTQNLQEIMALAVTQMRMTPAEALAAATINAAFAVEKGDVVGSIEVGKRADLAVFDVGDYREIPYLFGQNHCETVVKRGSVVVERGRIVYRQ